MLRWLERLIRRASPRFEYRSTVRRGAWECMVPECHCIVWSAQLAFHARSKHGWNAPNVTIEKAR